MKPITRQELIQNLKFHIESDDYFGTVAALLTLVAEDLERGGDTKLNAERIKSEVTRLMYLQKNYKIVKK